MDWATQSITPSTAALVLVTVQHNVGIGTGNMLVRHVLQQKVLSDLVALTHADSKQNGQPCVEHRSMTQRWEHQSVTQVRNDTYYGCIQQLTSRKT
jgi:hypothetical protein